MSQASPSCVSITATFTFPQNQSGHDQVKIFNHSNCDPSVVGLHDGAYAEKPKPGDYTYSGVHDHGILPTPKEGGDFALMIGLVNEARRHSDELLTMIIEDENKARNKHHCDHLDSVEEKKQKHSEE